MARIAAYVLCLMSVLATGCDVARVSIAGTVYDNDGSPGANLVIRAVRPEYPGILLRTGDDGSYEINSISTGQWAIEFYDDSGWLVGLESITVRRDETLTVDLNIGEKPLPDDVVPSRILNVP